MRPIMSLAFGRIGTKTYLLLLNISNPSFCFISNPSFCNISNPSFIFKDVRKNYLSPLNLATDIVDVNTGSAVFKLPPWPKRVSRDSVLMKVVKRFPNPYSMRFAVVQDSYQN